ncbi:carboxypeptidase-like regulatory domain-containing protein [Bacteroides sp. BFG-551]|nr:carboxypeptidase-like regulatory domain-containing protein [Bacteroides sp. BFG-551]
MRDSRAFKVVWIMLAVFLFVSTNVLADGIKVTGVVKDANGEGLPGVNVVEEGAKGGNGTITDMNGGFTLSVNNSRSQLRFSFIGYETQVVTVGKRTIINVELKEQTTLMDEVVVVGYGAMRRKDLSGAISSVRSSDLMQGAPTSLTQGLQGRPGGCTC